MIYTPGIFIYCPQDLVLLFITSLELPVHESSPIELSVADRQKNDANFTEYKLLKRLKRPSFASQNFFSLSAQMSS